MFKRSLIEELIRSAKALPKKAETKDELNVQEVVCLGWPAVAQMRKKGYQYKDIARFLIEQGVPASEETLLSALSEEARRRRRPVRNRVQHPSTESVAQKPPVQVQTPPQKVVAEEPSREVTAQVSDRASQQPVQPPSQSVKRTTTTTTPNQKSDSKTHPAFADDMV